MQAGSDMFAAHINGPAIGKTCRIIDEDGSDQGWIEWKRRPANEQTSRPQVRRKRCVHRGECTEQVPCRGCKGNVRIKVFDCSIFGSCTIGRRIDLQTACCLECAKYEAEPDETPRRH